MSWLFYTIIVVVLLAFNLYMANTMIIMHKDIKTLLKNSQKPKT